MSTPHENHTLATARTAYAAGAADTIENQVRALRVRTRAMVLTLAIGLAVLLAAATLNWDEFASGIASGMVAAGVYGLTSSLFDRRTLAARGKALR